MGRRLMVAGVSAFAAGGAAVALALPGGGAKTRPAAPEPAATRGTEARAPAPSASPRAPAASPQPQPRPRPVKPHKAHVDALKTLPSSASHCQQAPPPVPEHPITHRRWLRGVTITEYYPAPERWFVGRRIHAPGLQGTYSADWLYSARGLAMEGDGVDRNGRRVHIAALGSTGWVNAAGRPTVPVCLGKWTNGFPVWLIGGWRNPDGAVTFPLAPGGWSNGRGVRRRSYGGVTFAANPSLPLRYYHSIAVDPRLIPLGSRVYVPAYRHISGGWFVAQDTGGAIKGHHIDVYRPPPASPDDLGRYMTGRRILVIPPR
jgi:3D (Asp-Asp-Asp) domain-containing protein